MAALRSATGERVWYATHPKPTSCSDPEADWCSSGQYGAATVIPGAVFAGARDGTDGGRPGVLRAYSTGNGEVLWEYNTMQEYETVNGVRAKGGSIGGHGPAIVDERPQPVRKNSAGTQLYGPSGAGIWAAHTLDSGLRVQHHHEHPGQCAARVWRGIARRHDDAMVLAGGCRRHYRALGSPDKTGAMAALRPETGERVWNDSAAGGPGAGDIW